MSNLLFTPILKTKRSSEYNAIKEIKTLIEKNNHIIPYIECIKSLSSNDVKKYVSLLDNVVFFLEPQTTELKDIICDTNNYSNNCIISYRTNSDTILDDVETFIDVNHELNKSVAIKIDDADDKYISIIESLNGNDYLIIEIGGTSYSASSFLDDIYELNLKCKIIIHSNEREQYLRGEDFVDCDYNEKDNFNTSIIDSIKSGTFGFDGFGSRCSTKNDNTEDVKIAKEVYGIFLIFDYKENNFYSIKSDAKDHIGRVYTSFITKLKKETAKLKTTILSTSTNTVRVLDIYLSGTKLSASKIITVSIIRYIEEIFNNLYN